MSQSFAFDKIVAIDAPSSTVNAEFASILSKRINHDLVSNMRNTMTPLLQQFEEEYGSSTNAVSIDANGKYFALGLNGSIEVWKRTGSTWAKVQTIANTNLSDNKNKILMSKDSNYIVASGWTGKDAYIYYRSAADTWTLQKTIASEGSTYLTGGAVALTSDSEFLALSVILTTSPFTSYIDIYQRVNSTWTRLQRINYADIYGEELGTAGFVRTVDISADGKYIAVRGPLGDNKIAICKYNELTELWAFESFITSPSETPSNYYGNSFKLSHDGQYVVIGDIATDDVMCEVWERNGATWTLIQTIANETSASTLGLEVQITYDAAYILVSNKLGTSVEIWERHGEQWGLMYRDIVSSNSGTAYANISDRTVMSSGGHYMLRLLSDDIYIYEMSKNAVPTEVIAADRTLRQSDSGKTIFVNASEAREITLPAPLPGLRFRFVVNDAISTGNVTVVTSSSDNVIAGTVVVNGSPVNDTNADTITFVNTAESVGDWVELISDGTTWLVTGIANSAGAITLTTESV